MAQHVANCMILDEERVVFCSNCGAKLKMKIPEEDNRVRAVCDACNTIHYENPKISSAPSPLIKIKFYYVDEQ